MEKPRLFIASSSEGVNIANAINVNLDHDVEVTPWKNGVFNLTSDTLTDLIDIASMTDFAVFIFTPDDLAKIRDKEHPIARDNVVFELGLFIGSIGRTRCFVIKPRDTEIKLPSDLAGLNITDYNAKRSDNNLLAALNSPCVLIKECIEKEGRVNHKNIKIREKIRSSLNYELKELDYRFLIGCLDSYTSSPRGITFQYIENIVKHYNTETLAISAIKLERLGYVEKVIDEDSNGYECFTFSITQGGMDILINNQAKIEELITPPTKIEHQKIKKPIKDSFEDFDDDIPF